MDSDPAERPDTGPNGPAEALFESVNQYVESHGPERVRVRSELLARHPGLAGLLDCLDTLNAMAAVPAEAVEASMLTCRGDIAPEAQAPQADRPAAVCQFGKYELLAELGRGGMGVVYHARQADLDRSVALKMILSSQLASTAQVRRFQDEARAAARLRHPSIVAIHEVGQIHGQHYFTMDYIDGRSLADVLRDGRLEPKIAATCLLAVARAVDYLHSHGIVHRDLKPSNILLGPDGQPFVADFGLAKVLGGGRQHTTTGLIVGTPPYMSPEQAAGSAGLVTQQSDVYSLGAILYTMLTGCPPVEEGNLLDMLVQIQEREPVPPCRLDHRIPRSLERICLRCLEKNPHDRYPAAAALADDLDRFLQGEPVEAHSAGFVPRVQRWARRQPVLAAHLAGLLVAASIVQMSYFVRGVDLRYHLTIMALFAVWAVLSMVFQRALDGQHTAAVGRFTWPAADAVLLTAMLLMAEAPIGPLLVGYPLLIAASGLFFRVGLVWFMAGVTTLSYGVLVLLRPEMQHPPQYPAIFAGALVILGLVIAHQVHRVRALTRYYETRAER